MIEAAQAKGFELCWRPVGGKLCVGFVRRGGVRYPVFGATGMADWLRRGRVFAKQRPERRHSPRPLGRCRDGC